MPSIYLTLLAVALGAAASPLSTNYHDIPRERSPIAMAPLLVAEHPHGTVNNSYIVMLKSNIAPALMQNHMNFVQQSHEALPLAGDDELSAGLRHVYDSQIKGYAGAFSEGVIDRIRQMPEVQYIEKDQIVRTLEVPNGVDSDKPKTQVGAPWVSAIIV